MLTIEDMTRCQHVKTAFQRESNSYDILGTVDILNLSAVTFTAPQPIAEVLCFELNNSFVFFGYLCSCCKKIFFVKETWTNEHELIRGLAHDCEAHRAR
jgi:hypothetical protein